MVMSYLYLFFQQNTRVENYACLENIFWSSTYFTDGPWVQLLFEGVKSICKDINSNLLFSKGLGGGGLGPSGSAHDILSQEIFFGFH